MLFEEKIGSHLSVDETTLSNDEFYAIVTMADWAKEVLPYVSFRVRKCVQEVTLNMTANINLIIKRCFLLAKRVIDRFDSGDVR